ncbi:PREDICTED: uncharacterized protein LOC105571042 [Vollenhovia emeryi]|uniref:uncharacterized protein LOC105571042 n=1 Tax=Vollenhovia emeryi TaxID=411798 RepID=UPI0005F5864B|nr:PREDICTED: uncharacterized protein LOC105571042 [Vollenhovia emeryi]
MTEALEHQVQLLRQIDWSLENFKKIGKNNYTAAKIRNRLSALKELRAQVQTGHAKLRCTVSMESQKTIEYFKDNHFEVCEELYLRTSDYMSECLEEVEPIVSPNTSVTQDSSSPSSSSAFSVSHLPPISLPPFDGKFEEWESFRDRFTSLIIQNKELKDFARMHFLTSSLTGRALECVRNLPVTVDNFKVAWDTLKSRFECKRRLINVHLMSLLNLPVIQRESALDLQGLRDKTIATRAALTNLKRSPEELWNDMLVCLVSQKLDPVTRKAWKLKINDATTVPSYKSLDDFLDTRVRALEEWKPPLSAPEKSTKPSHAQKITSATASAKAPLQCSLCKSNHLLHACPQFAKKSTSQRRDFVKQDGRCFNCLSKGHAIQTCASKYTCRQCKKKHHTLLHDDSSSSSQLDDVTPSSQSEKSAEIKSAEVNSLS